MIGGGECRRVWVREFLGWNLVLVWIWECQSLRYNYVFEFPFDRSWCVGVVRFFMCVCVWVGGGMGRPRDMCLCEGVLGIDFGVVQDLGSVKVRAVSVHNKSPLNCQPCGGQKTP